MKDGSLQKLLGIVEVDETFVGGKNHKRHANKKTPWKAGGISSGKIGVIGAISRKGSVVCQMIENTNADTLSTFVEKTVSDKVKLIATDSFKGYTDLHHFYPHKSVDHESKEWVRGEVHTQSIESFWSLLKRGIKGQYHHVSKKYLPLYLAEFTFRFNNRKNPNLFELFFEGC